MALLLAPLVVVQPTLAAGLLVLLFLAQRMLGEHAGRYEHVMMCAIVIGVVGAALTAPPIGATEASDLTITLVLVGLAVASFLPFLFGLFDRRSPPTVTMLGAGLGFAWSGVATKLASDDLSQGHLGLAVAWGLSTAVASGVAVISEMSALQARPAIQVAPVVFVTQTVVPVVLAPLLFNERFSATPLGGIPSGPVAGRADRRSGDAGAFAAAAGADGRRAHEPPERLGGQPARSRARRRSVRARAARRTIRRLPPRARRRLASGAEAAAPALVRRNVPCTGEPPAVRASTS